MSQKMVDVLVKDLPFEAGRFFFATVKDGVAHVIVATSEKGEIAETKYKPQSAREWLTESRGILKGLEKQAHDDERIEGILKKHAPELLN